MRENRNLSCRSLFSFSHTLDTGHPALDTIPMTLSNLPFITPELPGTGGQIKAEPDHFIVEEVPLYEPSGEGDHLFVRVRRSGQTTRQVVDALAAGLGIDAGGIGYAGLKDRHARTTQVLSLPYIPLPRFEAAVADLDVEVEWAIPNNTKLKPGHLLGNRFTLTVLNPTAEDALDRAQAILEAVQERGMPNYFGSQRFGMYGDNAAQGLAILSDQRKRPGQKWLHKLLASAYQSQLFNDYLALRINRGQFDRILAGDLAKKTDTGGMFVVEDVATDQGRFDRRQITFTGPLYGYKMRQPADEAAALEAEILASSPVTPEQWRHNRVEGNRRPGRLFLDPIDLNPHPSGFTLSFFLPKGAYATILLREILKAEPDSLLGEESD